MNKTIIVSGINFPISGYAIPTAERKCIETPKPTKKSIPILSIPMMSDYKWQQQCLESRLKHPEWYVDEEDVEETILKIRKWLDVHKDLKE